MRHAAWFGSILLLAMVSATARAADSDLVVVNCSRGLVTVTAKSPWRPNDKGPWSWDRGSLISKDSTQVKFKGTKCEGTIKAYIVSGSQLKGPVSAAVR